MFPVSFKYINYVASTWLFFLSIKLLHVVISKSVRAINILMLMARDMILRVGPSSVQLDSRQKQQNHSKKLIHVILSSKDLGEH